MYDCVKADLEEKILRLEEDKNNVDINNGLWEMSAKRNRKRQVLSTVIIVRVPSMKIHFLFAREI